MIISQFFSFGSEGIKTKQVSVPLIMKKLPCDVHLTISSCLYGLSDWMDKTKWQKILTQGVFYVLYSPANE